MSDRQEYTLESTTDEDLSAIVNLIGALPDNSSDQIDRDYREPRGEAASDPYVITCEMREGRPYPLKQAEARSPLWLAVENEIAQGKATGLGAVLAGHLAIFLEPSLDDPARVMICSDAVLATILDAMSPESAVSLAELRLLKQLLCGLNLRDAALEDGVSHETKRTQYKSAARKLRARSQNELTSKVLARVLLSVVPAAIHHGGGDMFEELMREFVPQARTFRLRGPSGNAHRFIDVGPLTGTPAVMLHSQIPPDLRPEDIETLHAVGLRLILPLRAGALSAGAQALDVPMHMDHSCEAVDLARTHFCGEHVHLIGCISGCAYAIEYARRNPERVASFAFVGTCVRPNTGSSSAGRLRNGLFRLAMRNWSFYSAVLDIFGRRLRRPETFQRLISDVYRPNVADMAVIAQEFAGPHGGERVRKMFVSSVESIKHDFYHQANPRWTLFPTGRFPTIFLHGADDFIHSIADVRLLAGSLGGVPVKALAGAGQLLYHKHFEPMVRSYHDFVTACEQDGIRRG